MDCFISLRVKPTQQVLLDATFTMVALDKVTRKSREVPRLKISTPEEESQFRDAEEKKKKRIADATQELSLTEPTSQELKIIHQLIYISRHDPTKVDPEKKCVQMKQTARQSLLVMHPQQKNIHNKIFGGYLMRIGFEQAWASAVLFSGQYPVIKSIHKQHFIVPVEIGSICSFNSVVTYSDDYSIQVEVITQVESHKAGPTIATRAFLTFSFQEKLQKAVLPLFYDEAMKYIEAKRRMSRNQ